MNVYLSSIILGLIQGFTEFLPVSSSGHLVVFKSILEFSSPGALFEVVLHMGTVFAILWVYKNKIMHLKPKEIKLLLIGSVPAGVIGILFQHPIEALFSSTKLVGIALLLTALINYSIDRSQGNRENMDVIDSIFIGLAQAFAIIPGISRSGSTILAARRSKIDKSLAAEFSFLLSVPAVVGANFVEIYVHGFESSIAVGEFILGFLAAFLSGVLAISLVLKILRENKFKYFAYYCAILGLIVILFV